MSVKLAVDGCDYIVWFRPARWHMTQYLIKRIPTIDGPHKTVESVSGGVRQFLLLLGGSSAISRLILMLVHFPLYEAGPSDSKGDLQTPTNFQLVTFG